MYTYIYICIHICIHIYIYIHVFADIPTRCFCGFSCRTESHMVKQKIGKVLKADQTRSVRLVDSPKDPHITIISPVPPMMFDGKETCFIRSI